MKTCIICRQEKESKEFNEEHVIPDSIKGYYRIKSVCTNCNSTLGSKIDNKLTNHQFVVFQRHIHNIAGKSGKIPNPFPGTYTLKDDQDQKLRLELNKEGQFEVKLLPKVPREWSNNFQIIIDKKDEAQTDRIISKFLNRNGIPKDKVQIEKTSSSTKRPWVEASIAIDIKDFKMAILKIAYEFAVDTIPEYFNDPMAITISKLLENCEFENLYGKIQFIGNGFNDEILKPFSHLIEFENDNHYLILFDTPDIGLIGMVNLFNVFNLGVCLSENSGFIQDSIIVGKNDIGAKTFEKLTLNEIVSHTYSPINFRFQYLLPQDPILINEFLENDKKADFGFYREKDGIPFFDKDGNVLYQNFEDKLHQTQLHQVPLGDDETELITHINLDEELYIKLLPVNKLYQVVSVRLEQYKVRKI